MNFSILSKLKSPVYRNTAIYTISGTLSKGINFLILPFLSHYLEPEQLGIAANFDVLTSILSLLAGLVIVNGLPYFYYDRSKEEFSKLVFNLLAIIVIANIMFSIIILTCNSFFEGLLHIGLPFQLLTIVLVTSSMLVGINNVVYRMEDKPYAFAVLQLFMTVLNVVLVVYFVIYSGMQAAGKIYSLVLSNALMAILHFCMLYKRGYILARFDKKAMGELLKFGLPLLPHSLSFWIKSGFDKILLTMYCGLTVNGLYSMALSFGAVYSLFDQSFTHAYVPILQKRLNAMTPENMESEKRAIVSWSYKVFLGLAMFSVVVVSVCWIAINYFLSDKYLLSFEFIPFLILSQLFYSMYGLVIQYPYTMKKTFGMGVVTFTGAVVQLLLTFILVSTIGKDGIKISIVVGSLIIAIGVWIYSNNVYPMPWFSFKKK